MTAIEEIKGDQIKFTNGQERQFDAIVFATGFKSTVRKWLKVTKVITLRLVFLTSYFFYLNIFGLI